MLFYVLRSLVTDHLEPLKTFFEEENTGVLLCNIEHLLSLLVKSLKINIVKLPHLPGKHIEVKFG